MMKLSVTVSNCPLCGASELRLFERYAYQGMEISYQICKKCGLIFQSPRMSEDDLQEFYAQFYRQTLFGQSEPPKNDLIIQQGRANHIKEILQKTVGDLTHKIHLDIGCGAGILIQTLQESCKTHGFGVEPDNTYRDYVSQQNLAVYASLENWLQENQFIKADLVTVSHVLEHTTDPIAFLVTIRQQLLRPDGYLLVEVPNSYFHVSFELAHNFAFTPHTTCEILKQSGFQIIASKRHGIPLYKTPRYFIVIAKPSPINNDKYSIRPESVGVPIKRTMGRLLSKAEDKIRKAMRLAQYYFRKTIK